MAGSTPAINIAARATPPRQRLLRKASPVLIQQSVGSRRKRSMPICCALAQSRALSMYVRAGRTPSHTSLTASAKAAVTLSRVPSINTSKQEPVP